MSRTAVATMVCAAVMAASTVHAQSGSRNPVGGSGAPSGGSGGGFFGGGADSSIRSDGTFSVGSSGGSASTPRESAARGAAEYVRSVGQAQLLASESRIGNEQATKLQIGNRVDYARALVEIQRARQELEILKHEYQSELNRIRQAQNAERRSRRGRRPVERLTMADVDSKTGMLHWPDALLRPEFSAKRREVEELYAKAAVQSPRAGSSLQHALIVAHSRLKSHLGRSQVTRELGATRWVPAWQFMRRLENDIRLGPDMPVKTMMASN